MKAAEPTEYTLDADELRVYPGDKVWIEPTTTRSQWIQMTVAECYKFKVMYTEPDPFEGYIGARWNLVHRQAPHGHERDDRIYTPDRETNCS